MKSKMKKSEEKKMVEKAVKSGLKKTGIQFEKLKIEKIISKEALVKRIANLKDDNIKKMRVEVMYASIFCKFLRKQRKYSRAQFAKMCDVPESHITKFETDNTDSLNADIFVRIPWSLDMHPGEFFGLANELRKVCNKEYPGIEG